MEKISTTLRLCGSVLRTSRVAPYATTSLPSRRPLAGRGGGRDKRE